MARTKASVGAKISVGKSSKARCSAPPPPSSSTTSGGPDRVSRSYGGGNSVCPRETPKWQRPITNFFIEKENLTNGDMTAGSSKSRKRNVIESDDEEIDVNNSTEKPKNTVLDETIELEPLSGEDCHKIDEYYTKNGPEMQNGKKSVQNGEKSEQNGGKSEQNGDKSEQNGGKSEQNGEKSKQNAEKSVQYGEKSEQNGEVKSKGKGRGKKTNKENVDGNIERRNSAKRDLDNESLEESVSKKMKVN